MEKSCFTFWDIILDLRGTGLSYFLLSKKRIINPLNNKKYKEKKVHKVALLSKIFWRKINFTKFRLKLSFRKRRNFKEICISL